MRWGWCKRRGAMARVGVWERVCGNGCVGTGVCEWLRVNGCVGMAAWEWVCVGVT